MGLTVSKIFNREDAKSWKHLAIIIQEDFKEIPEGLFELANLQELAISDAHTFSSGTKLHTIGGSSYSNTFTSEGINFHEVNESPLKVFQYIDKLQGLESLQIVAWGGTKQRTLHHVPDKIIRLKRLSRLKLSGVLLLSHLPINITQIRNLNSLDVSKNKLSALPREIENLKLLGVLNLSNNQFVEVPTEIMSLNYLSFLNLSHNKIRHIPVEKELFKNLNYLNLANNLITVIPPEIGEFTKLERLDLSNSPEEEVFDQTIHKNQITKLPIEIRKLEKLETLDLRHNPLSAIPPEILELVDKPEAILSYYFEHLTKPLHEVKLLVVGQGSVGKTSLVQQILHSTFDQNQTKTEGISINQWSVDSESEIENLKSEIKLNIWDFGGQEIMHATHQFFLTKRSLYLLVLDARLTQEENRVEYWLKIIQSFGGESPVLIVGNKTDQHPLDIDSTGLQKKYPNIVGILATSAATGAGIETLKAEIAKQVDTLPHVRDLLPETWFTVKSKLEELAQNKNFFTQDEYLGLCDTNDVKDETSQHTLIGFLHDLGVVLHFQDDPRLEALGILNPQWVTNGVYKILNSHELFQNQGTLTLPILNKVLNLSEYPSNKRLFIVDMMKKFELCYDIEPDKSFLIPDLLPKDEPFTGEWDDALGFHYHYYILPSSIISRFIVRMNAFIYKTIWRSGVVLKKNGNVALVKADTEDKNMYIWVSGDENTRRDFLAMIRGEFDGIHKTIAKIEAAEKVPYPEYPDLVFDYKELLQFERDGINDFPRSFDGKTIMINVRRLLDGVADPGKRQQDLAASQRIERNVIQQQDIKKIEKQPEAKMNNETANPWKSGSFYLVSLALGIATYLLAKSLGLSGYDILAAFGVGISAMLIIGILQLRNDEKLEDASFVTLVGEFLKRFPFFRKSKDD